MSDATTTTKAAPAPAAERQATTKAKTASGAAGLDPAQLGLLRRISRGGDKVYRGAVCAELFGRGLLTRECPGDLIRLTDAGRAALAKASR